MSVSLLVVELAGRRAALPAEGIHSVIEPTLVVPVPRGPSHLAGLAALRSRPLTLIDCRAALGFDPGEIAPRAVVVEHEGHLYGLLVDVADEIVAATGEPTALAADPGTGWRAMAPHMIESAGGPLLLLDIPALIAGPGPDPSVTKAA